MDNSKEQHYINGCYTLLNHVLNGVPPPIQDGKLTPPVEDYGLLDTRGIYWHNECKGCVRVLKRLENVGTENKTQYLHIWTCLTHNKEICRDGWEWEHHHEIKHNYD